MKRGLRWGDGERGDTASSGSSSAIDTDKEYDNGEAESSKNDTAQSSKRKASRVDSTKKTKTTIDFEALSRHGYKGGLSVLRVPPPKEPEKEQDWSWSLGKEARPKEEEETYNERQRTRAAIASGEELVHAQTQKEKEKKTISFQQKEKRKRDLGQASRAKNYVEEEKRMLRGSGIYSGFDS